MRHYYRYYSKSYADIVGFLIAIGIIGLIIKTILPYASLILIFLIPGYIVFF